MRCGWGRNLRLPIVMGRGEDGGGSGYCTSWEGGIMKNVG